MIISILVDSLILFLLTYSLLDIFTHFASWLTRKVSGRHKPEICAVLFSDKRSFCAEHEIRRLMRENDTFRQIIIAEQDMCPEELEIIQRLSCEYENLRLMSNEEIINCINTGFGFNTYSQ